MAMETDQLVTGVVLQAKEWLYRRLYINHTTSIDLILNGMITMVLKQVGY